ncbi:hypothetical protein TNCV_2749301 [Trichonephila clavipes]|nr:hypothetical protein TNCV_2749301 [Trichonephila clavipes]
MFKGAKKEDLRRIASELELCVSDKLTILDFMDLIKNCDRYKNDPDFLHELANLIIEERKYEESQQLEVKFCLCKCCLKKHHSSLCFSRNPNLKLASEKVIQPSSLEVQKERKTEESLMGQLSAKASVFKPINYIGEISREGSSSQGVRDLFTASSYVKSKSVLLSTTICFIRFLWGNAGGQSTVGRWFNKQFYFATVYE